MEAFERVRASQSHQEDPSIDALEAQANLVLEIEDRALQIEDQARDRRASRQLKLAQGWLSIILKILAACTAMAMALRLLFTTVPTQYHQALHQILMLRTSPYGWAVAIGGGMFAVGKRLKGSGPETQISRRQQPPDESAGA